VVEFNTTLLASPVIENWPVYRFLQSFGYRSFIYSRLMGETAVDGSFTVNGYRNVLFQRTNIP